MSSGSFKALSGSYDSTARPSLDDLGDLGRLQSRVNSRSLLFSDVDTAYHHSASPPQFTASPPIIQEENEPVLKSKGSRGFSILTNPIDASRLAKTYKSRFQFYQLLFSTFIRWFLAVLILVAIFIVLKVYSDLGNARPSAKNKFNTITTALQILLSLVLFSSLKDLAKILRWRVLADRAHSIEDVDNILSADSLTSLTVLAWRNFRAWTGLRWSAITGKEDRRSSKLGAKVRQSFMYQYMSPPLEDDPERNKTFHHMELEGSHPKQQRITTRQAFWSFTKYAIWLLVNVAGQIAIALISLTYSTDAGSPIILNANQKGGVLTYSAIMSTLSDPTTGQLETGTSNLQALVHSYGALRPTLFWDYATDLIKDTSGIGWNSYYYLVQPDSDPDYWMYRFYSYDSLFSYNYTYAIPTDRYVNVTWSNCAQYPVLDGGDGTSSNVTYLFQDGSGKNESTSLYFPETALGMTTYISDIDFASCDSPSSRCWKVWVFQASPTQGSQEGAFVAACDITTDNVRRDGDAEVADYQKISDETAGLLSASIGLSGLTPSSIINPDTDSPSRQQFQRYTYGDYWSLYGYSPYQIGQTMAEYAIVAAAAISEQGARHPLTEAEMPQALRYVTGVQLTVHWAYIKILLPLIAGTHALLVVLTLFFASPYVVKDDSNLSNALFLRPIIEGIGEPRAGGLLTGQEIAREVESSVLRGEKVIYGTEKTQEGDVRERDTYRLGLFPVGQGRKWRWRHVDGIIL